MASPYMMAEAAAGSGEDDQEVAADGLTQRQRFLQHKAKVEQEKSSQLLEQNIAHLDPGVQEDARLDFQAGLIGTDLALTQKGQFEVNLADYPVEEDKEDLRDYFGRGFVDRDLQLTRRGELYTSDLETVLDRASRDPSRSEWIEWVEMGAWDEHRERTGEDPFLKQVGGAVKSLVTEVVPEAVAYGSTGIWASTPFIKAADWIGSLGILPPFTEMHEARKDAKLSVTELQRETRKELAAGAGAAARAGMENQVVLDKGRQLLQAKAQAGVTGAIAGLFDGGLGDADTAVLMALYDFENSKRILREASADEAAGALLSLAALGASEADRMEKAEFGIQTSQAARAGRSPEELARIDKEAASYGMLGADPGFVFTPAASLSAKGARTMGLHLGKPLKIPGLGILGRTTLKSTDDAAKYLAALTAKRAAIAKAAAREGAAPVVPGAGAGTAATPRPGLKTTGKRAARRTARQEILAKNLQRLDDEIYTAKRTLERHTARLGGVGALAKDGVREVSKTLYDRFKQTRPGSWATGVAIPAADDFLANLGRRFNLSSTTGSLWTGLSAFGLFSPMGPAAVLTLPALVSRQYRILRGATQMINAAGAEFFRRRVTMPYWQRVSERVAENPWASGAASAIDVFARPLTAATKATGNVGSAIARSTAAEIPFSAMATGGEEGWLVEAAAEGIAFGVPGQLQGIIHGLGGAPARLKKHEFDLLAQNDVAELRRNLSLGQREIFDLLDPVVKRQVGVYSALFPDVNFQFIPGSGGGAYREKTKTLIIDPESKNPLDVMLAHEIGHSLAARGMKEKIYTELVGPGGLLRDKDGNLTKEAKDFKREYENRLNRGRPPKEPRLELSDQRLAEEWFAEAVAPGLQKSQKLQKLVRRNKLITGLAEAVLPRVPFGKAMLLRRGVLLDKNGNLAKGQGAMVSANLSPALARLADAYLRNNAGSRFVPEGKRVPGTQKVVGGRTIEDLHRKAIYTREDMDRMEERNMIDYERNPDGSVKRDRFGRAKGLEPSVLAAQETTIGNIIRKVAEKYGVVPLTQKRGGDRFDKLTREQWDEILEEIRKTRLYNDHQIAAMRSAFRGMADNDGKAHRFQYHKALDTNEKTGKKRYKPKPQEDRVGSIYSIEVTKANNVIVKVIDMDALEERAIKASQSKDAPAMYRDNSADIMRDLMVLAENHNKPDMDNVDVFGEERARFLNGVLGQLSKEHAFNNPTVKGGRPPIRSFRLDRANFVYNTNEDGLTFNHHQWVQGLMPEPVDATNQQSDAQESTRSIPERGIPPGTTGERGDTTVSRGASSQRAGEARQVLAGVQATAERHRFGFAVDVKSPDFYNDPANKLYRSGDAGAAVTADGDLVSVYSVPGGVGNIDAVLREASQDAKTLDAFDIGGFLPNLYNRYGFRVVARVPFNREYAPPGWDFDAAGEPDVVLAVNDPSAEAVDYNDVRDSVPVFEDWDEAEAHRDRIAKEIEEAKADDIRRISDDDIRRMPEAADGSTPRMGVNINDATQAFTDQILAGKKTIETRDSNSLDPYLDQKVGLVRTGQGTATLVGYADIVGVKKYTSEAEFRKDQDAHLVEPGSKYDWTPKGKVGYVLANPEAVEPYELSSRGIVARDIRRMPEGDPQGAIAPIAIEGSTLNYISDKANSKAQTVFVAFDSGEDVTFDLRAVEGENGEIYTLLNGAANEEMPTQGMNAISKVFKDQKTKFLAFDHEGGRVQDIAPHARAKAQKFYVEAPTYAVFKGDPAELGQLLSKHFPEGKDGVMFVETKRTFGTRFDKRDSSDLVYRRSWMRPPNDDDIRRMPEQLDADHRAAVEAGDMKTAQRMVDEAAREAGLVRVIHSTPKGVAEPTIGPGAWVSLDNETGRAYQEAYAGDETASDFYKVYVPRNAWDDQQTGWDAGQTLQLTDAAQGKVKSADPATYDNQGNLIPLSERFGPSDDIRRMPEQLDADHRTAVEAGDLDAAQKIVDQAAQAAGFSIEPAYHGTPRQFTRFLPPRHFSPAPPHSAGSKIQGTRKLYYFSSSKSVAQGYADRNVRKTGKERVMQVYLKKGKVREIDAKGRLWREFQKEISQEYDEGSADSIILRNVEDNNVDTRELADTTIILDRDNKGTQMKLADPATYDDQGNLIPLSERFNPESDDIRRMPEDPTALPIVEARNEDGSVKKKDNKVVYETVDYDLLHAPALEQEAPPPQDTTKPDYDSLHYHVTKKDRERIDELIDSGAVDAAAADLEADARQAMDIPEIASGIGWYSRMRKKLRIALAGDHELFADLLGATSANTDVEQNFIYAFDAYRQFKAGKFDKMLKRFQEAVDLADSGKLKETMIARRIIGKRKAKRMDQQALLKKWIERYNLEPRRADGAKYGMNSAHVFRALSGQFTQVRGPRAKDKLSPKTPQFSMNLFGSSLSATIDVWAARYLRRRLYSGQVKQWRIQPKSETGVSNADFLLGQEIFRRAADKLGMSPDDLQALMWFKEKDVWDQAGWTKGAGAIKTSFDQAADAFFPPGQKMSSSQLAQANRRGLSSLNFIRKHRAVENAATRLEALAGQTGQKVTTAKRNLRNARKELTKARKRAGVAEFLERNPELN